MERNSSHRVETPAVRGEFTIVLLPFNEFMALIWSESVPQRVSKRRSNLSIHHRFRTCSGALLCNVTPRLACDTAHGSATAIDTN
jgi:hypothetical protein